MATLSFWSGFLICWSYRLSFWNEVVILKIKKKRGHYFVEVRHKSNWTVSHYFYLTSKTFAMIFQSIFWPFFLLPSDSKTRRRKSRNKKNINKSIQEKTAFLVRTCTSMLGQMSAEHNMKGNVGCGSCLRRAHSRPIHCLRPAWSSQVSITYQEKVSCTWRRPTTRISKAK
jgi:hypothetical protein